MLMQGCLVCLYWPGRQPGRQPKLGAGRNCMLCTATGGKLSPYNMGKKWMLEVNFYPFTFIFFLLAQNTVFINTYLMA